MEKKAVDLKAGDFLLGPKTGAHIEVFRAGRSLTVSSNHVVIETEFGILYYYPQAMVEVVPDGDVECPECFYPMGYAEEGCDVCAADKRKVK